MQLDKTSRQIILTFGTPHDSLISYYISNGNTWKEVETFCSISLLEGLNIYGVGFGIMLSNVEIQIVKVHLWIEGLSRSTSRL